METTEVSKGVPKDVVVGSIELQLIAIDELPGWIRIMTILSHLKKLDRGIDLGFFIGSYVAVVKHGAFIFFILIWCNIL